MSLHPLFALLYAMIGVLIWWAVSAHLPTFVVAYAMLAAGVAVIHFAYVQDRQRESDHNDD